MELHGDEEGEEEWARDAGHIKGSLDALRCQQAMGVGYIMPQTLERDTTDVTVHNLQNVQGVQPSATKTLKVRLHGQRLNKKMKLLTSIFNVVVGEEGRNSGVSAKMENLISQLVKEIAEQATDVPQEKRVVEPKAVGRLDSEEHEDPTCATLYDDPLSMGL